jgi:hypothetical protein
MMPKVRRRATSRAIAPGWRAPLSAVVSGVDAVVISGSLGIVEPVNRASGENPRFYRFRAILCELTAPVRHAAPARATDVFI